MRTGSPVSLESAPRFSVSAVAEGGSDGVELEQSRLVSLCHESRPMRLLSMAFESRSVVLDHC